MALSISDRRSKIDAELVELRREHIDALRATTFIDTWGPKDYAAYWERRNQIGILRGELADLDSALD